MTAWKVDFTDDTSIEVTTVIGDFVAFEADRKRKLEISSLADLTWIIWRACSKRLKITKLGYQEWSDTVADFNAQRAVPLEPTEPPSSE